MSSGTAIRRRGQGGRGHWLRRHRTLLAVATAWLTVVAWLPTRQVPAAQRVNLGQAGIAGTLESAGSGATAADAVAAGELGSPEGSLGTGSTRAGGRRNAMPRGSAGTSAATPSGVAGPGPTAAPARTCRTLVGPPPSAYFPTCVPDWSGNNGGTTAPGVSATKVRVADFWPPDPTAKMTPGSTPEDYRKVRDTFVAHFNQLFQLYGRQVEVVDFHAQNDDQRSGACIDAARLVENDVFALFAGPPNISVCAAERGVMSFESSADFPETHYAKYHPYIWNHAMDCERTAHQLAEYLGKRLAHRPAKWAGDAWMKGQTRRLGLYVPDDDIYGPCIKLAEQELERLYDTRFASVFRYSPTAERLADQANRAVLQFEHDKVTSVVLAADPDSITLLTFGATAQDWHPEWVTTGVASQVFDLYGRRYDQTQVDGHMFGRAAGPEEARYYGPDGEPNKVYRRLTGKDLPAGVAGYFYGFLEVFDRLQAAGPRLDANAVADGAFSAPEIGSPGDAYGFLGNRTRPDGSPGRDHTRQDSAREVYWDASKMSYDGQPGTFVSTMDGQFVRQGEWSRQQPAVYPGR